MRTPRLIPCEYGPSTSRDYTIPPFDCNRFQSRFPRPGETLILLGADVRAAAFSARRAGWSVWSADLFADVDLAAVGPARRLPRADYPQGFLELMLQAPPGPVLYTGGLENHPDLIAAMAQARPIWGASPLVLTRVRDPGLFPTLCMNLGLEFPEQHRSPAKVPTDGSFIIKPIRGAGGHGIQRWTGQQEFGQNTHVWQRVVPGVPHAALFLAQHNAVARLGVSRQLVGEPWLHAPEFAYTGSIGPVWLGAPAELALQGLGEAVVAATGLQGIFGVDFLLTPEGAIVPLEVNPRYTASVEVWEWGFRSAVLPWHAAAFSGGGHTDTSQSCPQPTPAAMVGKAILYARQAGCVPAGMSDRVGSDLDPWHWREVSDLPWPGTELHAGQPVLTMFARRPLATEEAWDGAASATAAAWCWAELQAMAARFDQLLSDA